MYLPICPQLSEPDLVIYKTKIHWWRSKPIHQRTKKKKKKASKWVNEPILLLIVIKRCMLDSIATKTPRFHFTNQNTKQTQFSCLVYHYTLIITIFYLDQAQQTINQTKHNKL